MVHKLLQRAVRRPSDPTLSQRIHGDINDTCFGLEEWIHDICIYDFSRSYSYTPKRPCMMNGTSKLKSLKCATDRDRRNVKYVTMRLYVITRLCTYSTC